MNVERETFSNLIEYYKLLPIDVKRKEILGEIEELISYYSKICIKFGVIPDMALSRETLNLNRNDLTEDEYLNAIYSYLNNLSEISAQFIDIMTNIINQGNIL